MNKNDFLGVCVIPIDVVLRHRRVNHQRESRTPICREIMICCDL